MRFFKKLAQRAFVQQVLFRLGAGTASPFIQAIERAKSAEFVDPESDDVNDYIQPGVVARVSDGREFIVTDEGAIHMNPHKREFNWMKTKRLMEREIIFVGRFEGRKLISLYGDSERFPPDLETE